MSNLEENARLSHELEDALAMIAWLHQENRNHCDHIAALQSREAEMKRQLDIALEQNCELRKECQRLAERIEVK